MATPPESVAAPRTETAWSAAAFVGEIRRASTWAQLARFAAVGASGYLVNLAVYWLALNEKLEYRAAATVAFVVALVNNFAWNKLWTFRSAGGRLHHQALRFIVVSVGAFLISLAILSVLVRDAGTAKLLAQAAAIVLVTPVSFLANRLWSFRTSRD